MENDRNQFAKLIAFLSDKGLIIIGKANKYYNVISLSDQEIEIFYESLRNIDLDNRFNLISSCLYFQSGNSTDESKCKKAKNTFYEFVEITIRQTEQIKESTFVKICNIIEFEEKYKICNFSELSSFLSHLQKFESLKKSDENYILYRYYMTVINYLLFDFQEAQKQYLETILAMQEKSYSINDNNSPLISYIKLKISLLFLMIEKSSSVMDINEYITIGNSLFQTVISQNIELTVKIGLYLFDGYKIKNDISNCLIVLDKMNNLLENYAKMDDLNKTLFTLNLLFKKAYCYSLINDNYGLISTVKDMEVYSNDLANSKKELNYNYLKNILDYVILNYNMNLNNSNNNNSGNNKNKLAKNDILKSIDTFKNLMANNSFNYLLFDNYNELYVNVFSINPEDKLSDNVRPYLVNIFTNINKGKHFHIKESILVFVYAVYNKISNNLFKYINDLNEKNKITFSNKVYELSSILLKFYQNNYPINNLFNLENIQNMIIRVIYAYSNLLFINGKIDEANNILKIFDDLSKKFNIINNKKLKSCGYIFKLKGDMRFKKGEFDSAINLYENSNSYFNESDEKEFALNSFNIGLCYVFLNNVDIGKEVLNSALFSYIKLLNNCGVNDIGSELQNDKLYCKKYFEKKIAVIQNILKKLNDLKFHNS